MGIKKIDGRATLATRLWIVGLIQDGLIGRLLDGDHTVVTLMPLLAIYVRRVHQKYQNMLSN